MLDDEFEKRETLQADPQKESFLPILDEQVHILVHEGRTNLSRFLTSLESLSILSCEEISELRIKFNLEMVGYPFSRIPPALFNNGLQGHI